MALLRDFGWTEGLLCLAFLLFYGAFAFRTHLLNARLGRPSYRLLPKALLRAGYFSLALLALLGPSFGEQQQEVKAEGKDIFFLVDLSRSMDAQDLQPSRMEKVKFELAKIVNAFRSDRIGLIIFTSEAFLQCPLTFDHTALLNLFIAPMSTNQIYNKGTDFGPAMEMALKKLLDDEYHAAQQKSSKIIVLVSDGEDFGDDTEEIASKVKEAGIKMFTLGVGTQEGGKIPDGYRFKRDNSGNDVVTTLNADALQRLAKSTGGQYFELSDERNDISRLIGGIGSIKGELRDARMADVSANKYHYFLLAAFLMLLADVLLTVKIVKI
jgi:Ca-activated chloride channel family protein